MLNSYETENSARIASRSVISWPAVFAGLLISLLTFAGLIAVSMAFGGIGLADGTTAKAAGAFVGITMAVALIVSTFAGSYFAVRASRMTVDVVGCMQGLVVGALTVIVILAQTLSTAGAVGRVASEALGNNIAIVAENNNIPAANEASMISARETTAKAMRNTGWTVFVIIVLSASASVLGGLTATKNNERYLVDLPDSMKKAHA